MPDKPLWYARIDSAIAELEVNTTPWVDRSMVESLLGVGRRRAQQFLQPLVRSTVGRSGLADRQELILYLRQLASGARVQGARERRIRFQRKLDAIERLLQERPSVWVEAPEQVISLAFDSLPSGIAVSPGRIIIEGFTGADAARRLLLALVMAMGNDPDEFERRLTHTHT